MAEELTSSEERRRFIFGDCFDWLMLLAATVQHQRVNSFITILSSSFGSEVFADPSTNKSAQIEAVFVTSLRETIRSASSSALFP